MELAPPPAGPATFELDRRLGLALGLGLVGLGLLIGFRLAGGVPQIIEIPQPFATTSSPVPCADCAERAIQEERQTPMPVWGAIVDSTEHATPGDSSIPAEE
jgi:hypothetical protein